MTSSKLTPTTVTLANAITLEVRASTYELAGWGIKRLVHAEPLRTPTSRWEEVWGLGSGLACSQLNCFMAQKMVVSRLT